MSKPKVFVTRNIPEIGMKALHEKFEVTQWKSDDAITQEALLAGVKGVDALLCLLTDDVNADVIKNGENLKVISTLSVGFEHIDKDACKARGIQVGNTPAVSAESVAEFTLALLLAAGRRVVDAAAAVKNGEWGDWKPMWLMGHGLNNSVAGVVGLGAIGFSVANKLDAFHPRKLLYFDVKENEEAAKRGWVFSTLDEVMKNSDFICVCCPLIKATANLMNAERFAQMKPNCIMVNTSRGGVVDQEALYNALKSNQICAAAIDVTVHEPLPPNDKLLTLPNLIVTPHTGSATVEAREAMSSIAANNIINGLAGQPMPGAIPNY